MDNKYFFYKGNNFRWKITNRYGHDIDSCQIRDLNIDNILGLDITKVHDLYFRISFCLKNGSYMDHDYWENFTYNNGVLKFNRFSLNLDFKSAEKFIKKLIDDSGNLTNDDMIYDINSHKALDLDSIDNKITL